MYLRSSSQISAGNCIRIRIRIRLLGLFHGWLLGPSHYTENNTADKQERDAVIVKYIKVNKTRALTHKKHAITD